MPTLQSLILAQIILLQGEDEEDAEDDTDSKSDSDAEEEKETTHVLFSSLRLPVHSQL